MILKDSKLLIVLKFKKTRLLLLKGRILTEDASIAEIVVTCIEPESDNYTDPANHCLFTSLEE